MNDADIAGAMGSTPKDARPAPSTTASRRACWPSCRARASCTARTHHRPGRKPGDTYRIQDLDLASRLSFFLWSGLPDDELIDLAAPGACTNKAVLESEVRRMLRDPRAHTMVRGLHRSSGSTSMAWTSSNTDVLLFPDFTADLIPAFKEELFRFVGSVFEEDRNVNDLLTANWTFLNERLALHYGIKGVRGGEFRKVTLARGPIVAACSARARC